MLQAHLSSLLEPFDWDIVLLEYALNDQPGNTPLTGNGPVTVTFEHLVRGILKAIPGVASTLIHINSH